MDKAEKIGEKSKALDELKELNDKIQNEELLTKLDKFKKSKIKPKFRTVGGVDKEVLCRKESNYGTSGQAF
jgi:hypothetical protein